VAINAPNLETECLYSSVRNVGPVENFFGFLPPHGKRLACGEEFAVWGDIQHWLTRYTPDERARRSLEAALADNDVLVIIKSDAPHLNDEIFDVTKILTLDSGNFAAADPCWGEYSGNTPIPCFQGILPFGGTQPPSFTETISGITFDNANAAWQWDSPDTIYGPATPGEVALGTNGWHSWNPLYLGQCAGDRLATRPIPDSGGFGTFPLYVSVGDDVGRRSISAGWGGNGVRNVEGQDDLALFENGSAPPSGEEGFTVAVHHQEENAWSAMWFKEPVGWETPYAYGYLYDLSDFGIPVGDHIDAICFQNVVRGDRTAVQGECGYVTEDGYGFIVELGDGTGPIYLTGLTGVPLAASKCDPDVDYVVALSPIE